MRVQHEILSTTDYSIFKSHYSNRTLDDTASVNHLKRLMAAIQARNLLPYRPLYVNRDMQVVDGQFRLEAAKKLNLRVFYQVNEEACVEDMVTFNVNIKGWDSKNYLNFFVKNNHETYVRFNEFISEHKISVRCGLLILASAVDNASYHKFKTGTFLFPDSEEMKEINKMMVVYHSVIDMIKASRPSDKSFLYTSRFQLALIEFLNANKKDITTVQEKLEKYVMDIIPCFSYEIYMNLLKDIYARP